MRSKDLDKASCERQFITHYNATHAGMGATRSAILKLLRSIDLIGWSSHEDSGRLDKKGFARYAAGNANVFKRRDVHEATASCVSVLIDCSGSMSYDGGGRIAVASEVAVQLAKIFNKAKISFAVTGFNGNDDSVSVRASGANTVHENLSVEEIHWIPFKAWGESLQRAAPKLGSIQEWTGYSTPDYSALSYAIDDIAKRPESRKILFILTDADGYNKTHIRHLQKLATKQGVTIIAIGIEDEGVNQVFDHAASIKHTHELASTAFNKLLHTLRG
jgi:cobalamin biosynthesis protein CobT